MTDFWSIELAVAQKSVCSEGKHIETPLYCGLTDMQGDLVIRNFDEKQQPLSNKPRFSLPQIRV